MKNYFIHNVHGIASDITPKELTKNGTAYIPQPCTTENKQKSKTSLLQNPVIEPCEQDLIYHLENEFIFAEFRICRN